MTARPLFRVAGSYAAHVTDGEWLSLKNRIWVLIVIAVGFGLRVYALNAQSLWNDEGTSVALAQTSLAAIINAAARDIHPPFYYIMLSGWIQIAGITEFAVRFLSVFAGVLVIALTFRIAREFFDQDVAVIAAVLSALNPFQTYYAQETRMYIWVTLFAALSVWAMVGMFKPPRQFSPPPLAKRIRRRVAFLFLYISVTLAALYTNYYAFTLLVLENLVFVAWLAWALRARRPRLGHAILVWFAAQIVIGLAFLPWLGFARQSLTSWPGISEPMSLFDMAWRIASAFATGIDSPHDFQVVLVAAYTLFFVGGLLPSRDMLRQSAWGIVTCALWAIVPLLAMYVVSLSRPAYNPKFLLLATPGFLILVARGVSVLYPGLFLRERAPYAGLSDPVQWRLARQIIGIGKLLIGGLFAAGIVLSLQNLYGDPRLQRDDYRGILNYINAVGTARDAVIVDAPGQLDVVRYYYRGSAPLTTLPVGRPLIPEQTLTEIVSLLRNSERLYAIYWATEQADPQQFVERTLSETTFKASDEWHGNVRLAEYGVQLLTRDYDGRIRFGDGILLRRFGIGDMQLAGGDILPLHLVWVALTPPGTNYKIFAHVLDSRGRIIAQHDGEPQNGFAPTGGWQVGNEVSDKIGVVIPPGTPPGEYSLVIGIYRADTGERLKLADGTDALTLGSFTVGRRIVPRAALFLTQVVSASFGAVDLIGFRAEASAFVRGEFIPLVLYFQAREKTGADASLYLELLDQGDNIISSARPFEQYPSSHWDKDEIVRDVQSLTIPQDALPGEYRIVVTDNAQTVELMRVQIR